MPATSFPGRPRALAASTKLSKDIKPAAPPPLGKTDSATAAANVEPRVAAKSKRGKTAMSQSQGSGLKTFDSQQDSRQDDTTSGEPAPNAFCTEMFEAETANDSHSLDMIVVKGFGESTMASSAPATPSPTIKSMSPERTPPTKPTEKTVCSHLLNQSIGEFIDASVEQIERLGAPGNTPETYKALVDSLRMGVQDETWSDGAQWAVLVDAGMGDRPKSSLYYALAAIAFVQWNTSQVQLLERIPGMNGKDAAASALARILGPKPEDGGAQGKTWERRRHRIATHLTRGGKWARLVDAFGLGILFKSPW